jgi:LPXTG-site transpeptidase (sortase) family protein
MLLLMSGMSGLMALRSFGPASPVVPTPAATLTLASFARILLTASAGLPALAATPASGLNPSSAPIGQQALTAEPPPFSQPPRLQISSLNLDEPITIVPIRDGLWDLEHLGSELGWLSATGSHPEDKWAMVLAGHITLITGERGAFADLEQIDTGARLAYIWNGFEYLYEVRRKSRVAPDDVQAIFVPDGKVLLLMTCTDFDFLGHAYANRLLVRAELIEKRPLTP